MAPLLPGIAFEALTGFMKKLGRHAQVHLRVPQMDMAEINRQVMHESLYVGAFLIPRRETVDSEGMAKAGKIYLGINARGVRIRVPQLIADLLERQPVRQQSRCAGM